MSHCNSCQYAVGHQFPKFNRSDRLIWMRSIEKLTNDSVAIAPMSSVLGQTDHAKCWVGLPLGGVSFDRSMVLCEWGCSTQKYFTTLLPAGSIHSFSSWCRKSKTLLGPWWHTGFALSHDNSQSWMINPVIKDILFPGCVMHGHLYIKERENDMLTHFTPECYSFF